jgi:hypothetical protein
MTSKTLAQRLKINLVEERTKIKKKMSVIFIIIFLTAVEKH